MLESYWDESGSTADPACTVVCMGGLIAAPEGWRSFEEAWQKILLDFNLSAFHMKDFAHWRGDFHPKKQWPEERRRELMSRLLAAIEQAEPRVHGAVLDLEAWRALPGKIQTAFIDPWYCCLQEVARLSWVHAHAEECEVQMWLSRQDEFGGRAEQLWEVIQASGRYDGLSHLGMEDMRQRLPLQAADLVAYELLKFDPNNPEKTRVPLRTLLDIDPHAFVVSIDSGYLAAQAEGVRLMLERESG